MFFVLLAKSSLVNYERDSDDDEHTDEEEEEEDNEEQDMEDKQSNSNSADLVQGIGDADIQAGTATTSEQTIITSDLLTVTPVCVIGLHSFSWSMFSFVSSSSQKMHHPHLVLIRHQVSRSIRIIVSFSSSNRLSINIPRRCGYSNTTRTIQTLFSET